MKPRSAGHLYVSGQNRMRRATLTVFLFAAAMSAFAIVSPDSAQLETLRLSIERNGDPNAEREYLRLFPSDHQRFRRIFMGNDEEFDELVNKTDEHLSLIKKLSERYPKEVLDIWLGVATNGHWDADAVGGFQRQLAQYASDHTREFASALIAKAPKKRASIIRFLADVENHYVYSEYSDIAENLNRLGYSALALQFAEARSKRMSEHDH